MKNTAKKLFSLLLAVIMVFGSAPMSVFAAQTEQAPSEQTNSTSWNMDSETGTLTVSGSGDMDNLINPSDYPWYIYKNEIKAVVIESGVNSVGANAFRGYPITTVSVASTVEYIGDGAFADCEKLIEIGLDESFTGFGKDAFVGTAHYLDASNRKNGAYYINNTLVEADVRAAEYTVPAGTLAVADFAVKSSSTTNINILSDVKYIGSRAFAEASALKAIIVDENNPYFSDDTSGALYNKEKTKLICVPSSAENMAKFYNVNYYVDGQLVHTESVEEYKAIPEYTYDPGEGKTFSGWSGLPETMPENDIDVHGTYTVNKYTITYILNDEIHSVADYFYGETIVAPEYNAPVGHEFSGWTVPETMPAENLTLKATLSVCTYNAIFYLDDSLTTVHATVPTTFGEEIEFPANPYKEGFVFLGWDDDSTLMDAEGKIYVALWAEKEFVLTFRDFNGVCETIYAYAGQIINEDDIPAPTFPGYIFEGWVDSDGNKVTFPLTVSGDMEFTAMFVAGESTYSVEIYVMDTNGEYELESSKSYSATTDSYVTYSPETREGFSIDVSYSKLEDYVTSDGVVYLYVYYSRNKYNVTIDGKTNQYYYGETVALSVTEPEGMIFNGWYDENGNKYTDSFTVPASDTVLNPRYTVKTYTVTFRIDGSVYSTLNCEYGSSINAPHSPQKDGYTFAGWSNNGLITAFPIVVTSDSLVFDAVFTANGKTNYKVEIYLMGTDGKYADSPSKTDVTKTQTIGLTATAAHSDYEQDAWFSADKSAANVTSAKVSADGSTILKLYYARAKYAVTVDGVKTADVYHGATFIAPSISATTPAGYELASWNGGAYAKGQNITVTAPIALVADYVASVTNYTIKIYFMDINGKYSEAIAMTKAGTTDSFVSISHNDYPYEDWFSADTNAANVTSATVSGDGSTVLKLYYARAKYPVTVDGVKAADVYHGATFTAPAASTTTEVGYELKNWNNGAYAKGEAITIIAPLTLVANNVAGANKVVINAFYDDAMTGGTVDLAPYNVATKTGYTVKVVNEIPAEPEENVTYVLKSDLPTAKHYEIDPATEYSVAVKGDGSATLDIAYVSKKYTVEFLDINGNSLYKAKHDYFDTIDAPGAPDLSSEGKIFEAWVATDGTSNSLYDEYATFTVEGNVTYKATYTNLEFGVFYASEEVDGWDAPSLDEIGLPEESVAVYGDKIVLPDLTNKVTGYEFLGYEVYGADYDDATQTVTIGAESVDIIALWDRIEYSVTYVILNESITIEYYYGDPIDIPEDPAVANFTFIGWDTEIPATMPAYDLIITALFERNLPVMLIPAEGSTTIIDRDGGTTADYVDGESEWMIYGLREYLNEKTLLEKYLDVQGDGFIKIIPASDGYYGTGTTVEVWDSATMELVESFRIVVFCDLNGDSVISAVDYSMVIDEAIGLTSWSYKRSPEYMPHMVKAANLDGNTRINSIDASLIEDIYLGICSVDQTTGTVTDDFPDFPADYTTEWKYDAAETLSFRTEIFRMSDSGEWEAIDNVKAGEDVKARVYIDTSYYTNAGSLLFFYDSNFFTDGYKYNQINSLKTNSSARQNGISGEFTKLDKTNPIVTGLVSNGYISQSIADSNEIIAAVYTFDPSNSQKFEGDEWILEFDLTVKEDASGYGNFYVIEDTVKNADDGVFAFVNVPVGEDGESQDKSVSLHFCDSVCVEITSTPVSVCSPVEITFDANGGTFDGSNPFYSFEALPGEAMPEIPEPYHEGYYFVGWSEDPRGSYISVIPEVCPDMDIVYYAIFESELYNVTYHVYNTNGTLYKSVSAGNREYGDIIPLSVNNISIPEGYALSPAYADKEFTEVYPEYALMPACDVDVYFILVPLNYEAVFDANGGKWADGDTQKTVTVSYDSQIVAPEAPKKVGYRFVGWTPDVGLMDEDKKLFTATWEKETYSVTYLVDGDCYEIYPLEFGDEMEIPADPYKNGYYFVGWTPAIPETMPAEDISFTAVFEAMKFEVVFDANDGLFENGESIYTITVHTDETIPNDIPSVSRDGYSFIGWQDGNGNDVVLNKIVVDEDIVLCAKWEIDTISGNFENIEYIFNKKTGELVISGEGEMPYYLISNIILVDSIKSLVICDGITTVSDYAFCECPELESVVIADSVTSIGEYAFAWNYELKSINIPNSVTSIGDYAFEGCYSLAEITIPDSVTSIGDYTFYGCGKLESVTIGNNVTSISNFAFSGCSSLAEITIPDSVTSIGDFAFTGCSSLAEITLSDSVTEIRDGAFNNCRSLAEITLPESITSIGASAFAGCSSLTEITIPSNVDVINENTFHSCRNLASISIPSGVTSIGRLAFAGCIALEDVYFGGTEEEWNAIYIGANNESLTNANIHFAKVSEPSEPSGKYTVIFDADWGVFADGSYTKTIYLSEGEKIEKLNENPTCPGFVFAGWVDEWGEDFDFENAEPNNYTIYANWADLTGEYESVYYSYDDSTGELIIEGEGEIIPEYFASSAGIDAVTSVVINNGITGIDYGAFSYCLNLTSITIPDSVTSIGDYAFEGCENLESVTIGNSVTSIGDCAFDWCEKLTNITIPDSVTSIGDWAFSYCTDLTSITIPNSVTSISDGAFADCYNLESVTIGNSVTNIGDWAFSGCNSLTNITIPDSVASIDAYAFHGCNSLTSITIPDSVTFIGYGAFYDCLSLTDVYYSGTEEEWNAIYISTNNEYLSNATVHYESGVIETASAFSLRSFFGLTKEEPAEVVFKVPETVTEIGDYAFMYSNATKVKIPASVTTISETAFAEASSALHFEVAADNEVYKDKDGILFTENGDEIVAYPRALTDSSYTLPIGTKSIGAYAFNGSALEKIYLPSSLESIGDYAFCNSDSLVYADIENNVTYIGDYAFFGCPLETADMPYDLASVGAYAFFGSKLEKIEISESVNKIGKFAFAGNSMLEEINVNKNNSAYESDDNGVLYIKGQSVLIQYPAANSQTSFALPETVGEIDDMAFYASKNLNEIVFCDNLAIIGDRAFEGCSSIRSIILPEGIERLGDEAFFGCSNVLRMKIDAKFADKVNFKEMTTLMDLQFAGDSSSLLIPETISMFEAVGSYDDIALSWSKSIEANSSSYRIFRKGANDSEYSLVKTIDSRTTLTYADSTVEEDIIYKYIIVTVSEATGIVSPMSREATSSKSEDNVPPVVTKISPDSLSYISGTETFVVYADDDLMMSKVTLQYSTDNGNSWTFIGTNSSKPYSFSFDTTALTDGIIKVKALAYDTAGNESEPMTLSYTVDNTGPQKIKGLKVNESAATSITIAWEDVAAGDAAVFVVQMKNNDGTYTTVADSVSDLSYKVNNLAPDTDYVFRVAAKDERGNLGEYSDDFTASTSSDTTAPDTKNLLPTSGRHNKDISFKVTATDNYAIKSIAVQVSTDKINWETVDSAEYTDFSKSKNFSCVIKISDYNDGGIFIRAVATDFAGNNNVDDGSFDMVEYIVDTTAPASPEGLYAAGGDGWIYLHWEIGSESDLYTYSVYRSTEENGNYALIANYLAKYDYYDTAVSRDTVYYYKIRVIDTLGNISDFSAPVSAKVADDVEPPQIISINPATGKEVSPLAKTITVYAKDNASIANIRVEYKLNDASEYTLIDNFVIDGKNSVTAKTDLPADAIVHGDKITVHVVVTDITGLTAEQTVVYTYAVDSEAPVISNLGVTVDGDYCKITWNDPTDTDASGYKIYRVNDDGTFTPLGSRAKSTKHSYTFYDNVSVLGTGDYAYKVEAYDASGNINSYFTEPVHYEYVPDEDGGGTEGGNPENPEDPENPDEPVNAAPNIKLSAYSVLEVGVEEYFDAGGSYDDSQIVSFLWDFGDGTTSNEVKAAKKYTAVGVYTVTLTVTDDGGLSTTATIDVTVHEREALGTVKVTVVDSNGKVVPDAHVFFDVGGENEKAVATDKNGVASLKMESGTYYVCVRIDDYVPDIKTVTVLPNAERRITLRFIEQKIVEGEFEVKRLTHEEVENAGIDTSGYDNQNFYQATVTIQYGGSSIPLNYIRTDNEIISESVSGGDSNIIINTGGNNNNNNNNGGGSINPNPRPDPPIPDPIPSGSITITTDSGQKELKPVLVPNNSGEEILMVLEMPIGARNLKEMFEVSLHLINNAHPTFTLLENEIALNIPDGMSLVKNSPSKERVILDTIEDSTTVRWLLKGDEEGNHNLTADYNGKLSIFKDSPVTASFSTNITVYGLSDVKINVQVSDEIRYNAFYFNIGLENDGTVDQLNLNLNYDGVVRNISASTLQRMAQEETGEEGEIDTSNDFEVHATLMNVRYVYADGTYSYIPYSISDGHIITGVNTIAPGEAVYYEYVAYNAVNYDGVAVFEEAAVEELSKYSSNVTVTPISMNLYDKLNVVERLTKYGSADKDALNYLISDEKYFYWNQATGTAENSIGRALYNCANAVFGTRFKELNHAQKYTLAEKVLLHHFAGTDVIENIGDVVEEKYVFLIQKILSQLKANFVADDFEENANLQSALEWIENAINDYDLLAEFGAAIRMKGAEGLKGDLISALCVAGEAQLVKYDSLAFLNDNYVVNAFADLCDYSKELLNPSILDPVKRVSQEYFNQYVYNAVQTSVCVEIVKSITSMFEKHADKSFLDSDYVGIVKVISEKYFSVAETKNLALVSDLSKKLEVLGHWDDTITENILVKEILSPISSRTNYLYTILDIAYDSFESIAGIGREYLSEDIITLAECVSTVFVNAWIDHNAEYEYNGQSLDAAVDASHILMYLAQSRLAGESLFKEFVADIENHFLRSLNEELHSDYESVEEVYDEVYKNILEARDTIFNIEETQAAERPEAPVVSINYDTLATNEKFDETYEFCYSDGEWQRCNGEAIPIKLKSHTTVLRVRKASADGMLSGEITTVTIWGQREMRKNISVKYDNGVYYFTNLSSLYNYQICPLENQYDEPDWSKSVTVVGGYNASASADFGKYLAIRSCENPDKKELASKALILDVNTKQLLTVSVWGSGSVTQSAENGRYFIGEDAYLTATPNESVFDGWYIDGQRVSGDKNYIIEMYEFAEIVAKFSSDSDVPPESAELLILTDNEIYSLSSGQTIPMIFAGAKGKLIADISPENASDKSVKWKSSNENIAAINANGIISFLRSGTVTVTATLANGITESAKITVLANGVEECYIDSMPEKTTYYEDEELQLDGLVLMAKYTNGTVKEVSDYTVEGFSNSVGEKTVVLNYKGATAELKVKVIHNCRYTVSKEATCSEEGVKTKYCVVCGIVVDTQSIPSTEHTCKWVFTKEATPETKGVKEFICTVCGVSTKNESVDYCEHEFSCVNVPAECEKEGYTIYSCNKCDYEKTDDYTEALNHSYTETVINPTCTTNGFTVKICRFCSDKTVINRTGAVGHNYVETQIEASCSSEGYTLHSCSNCGNSYKTNLVKKLPHNYSEEITEPTCFAMGYTTHTCSVCGNSYVSDEVNTIAHQYESEKIFSDCTSGGYTLNTCKTCGETQKTDIINPAEHTYGEWIIQTPSSEFATGLKYRICTTCSNEESQIIPIVDHEHIPGEWIEETSASCNNYGVKVRRCEKCRETVETEIIPAPGHNYSSTTIAPTCTKDGYTVHHCSVCGNSYTDSTVLAGGHSEGEWITVTEPDCDNSGLRQKYCDECKELTTEEILPALSHSSWQWSVVTESTCTEAGLRLKVCDYCEKCVAEETIPAEGHKYSAKTTPLTCTEDGFTTYTCSICFDSYESDRITATGHADGDWVVSVEPTVETEGKREKRCKVCGELIDSSVIPTLKEPISGITISEQELEIVCEETVTLVANVTPENAIDKTVVWLSDNPHVAHVDENGKVTAITPGTATITASTANGEFSASCEITVISNMYKVSWSVDGETITETVRLGAEIEPPANPEKKGYKFEGWTPDIPDSMPKYDLEFTATWSANVYNAVFDANGGKWADGDTTKTAETEFGSMIVAPENPVRDGYVFGGWDTSVGIMNSVDGKIYKAVWLSTNEALYTVETYLMNTEGEYEKTAQTLNSIGGSTVTLSPEPEAGLVLNAEKSVLSGMVTADNALVLKVYIDREIYSFSTVVDGVITTEDYYYGSILPKIANPVKEGYEFSGWDKPIPNTMPASDLTVTAVFSKIATSVKIVNNPESITINHGETLNLTSTTSDMPEGAYLVWYVNGVESGTGESYSLTVSKGSVTVEVKVVDKNGKVLTDENGAEISDSQKVTVNSSIWQRIVSFFKNLFRMNRTVIQLIFNF